MKKWIIIAAAIYFAVTACTISILSVQLNSSKKVCANLQERTEEQSRVIDSLLARRMTVFDVQLHVQDKSKFAIHGQYNKGTINVPSIRTYELVIDSTSINVK